MAVELRVGTAPHQYRLDTEIGSGGFGVVYEGTDLNNGLNQRNTRCVVFVLCVVLCLCLFL